MKINELMIGDYATFKVGENEQKVIKITADWLHDLELGIIDFTPIPLTEEILVKNGFKKESQTIDGDYCKYTLPGFALNWCDTDGFWYQNGDITPNHVHTLQHLLRLAGIDKEIEL